MANEVYMGIRRELDDYGFPTDKISVVELFTAEDDYDAAEYLSTKYYGLDPCAPEFVDRYCSFDIIPVKYMGRPAEFYDDLIFGEDWTSMKWQMLELEYDVGKFINGAPHLLTYANVTFKEVYENFWEECMDGEMPWKDDIEVKDLHADFRDWLTEKMSIGFLRYLSR